MNVVIKILITISLYLSSITLSFSMENTFYILRSNSATRISSIQDAYNSLKKNASSITLLISQAYQIDQNGAVWGFVDPDVLELTRKQPLKLMVLVTNAKFDTEKTHLFLTNSAAQTRAIDALVDACLKQHYYGVQFDFEMVRLQDRDALTQFYQKATDALHKKGFIVSYAVAPVVSDHAQSSEFLKRIYDNWEGAYDLTALGKMGDFATVMAYNQHGDGTTPGPTASAPWVEETIKYTLHFIPANKISLGIAVYSNYWYTGTGENNSSGKITTQIIPIGFEKAKYLLHKYHGDLLWNAKDKVNYTIYNHDWLNEYIYFEDEKSFKAKLDLVEKNHLRGISVFDIGSEDPNIWKLLKSN